ncbi:hypothetical protein [Beggiatoa leptomitoformis]|uniref:Uncharacterized protein n=1 Tax=Beggiatoa leptomitoformis TaxID=288004 RepID=A0A2N9Y9W8_9GAMM|nr:hypothetical protein [Beggiatoa leptomitoformis]ALG67312.1 hypothetical protein AL038_05835 [Beggiatoa leptomitoformis]AUI67254.1 hypothetical protein BLE401_00135 [Beggiatoa leptomitoformis]
MKKFIWLFFGLSIWFHNAFANEEMVVIRSNTALFSVGQLLSVATPLTLPQDTEITLVFADGQALTLHGEYQGQVQKPHPLAVETTSSFQPVAVENAKSDSVAVALAGILQSNVLSTPLTRSPQESPTDLWLVDISTKKRHYCVADPEQLTLWRPENDSRLAGDLLIKHKSTGQQSEVVWPANRSTIQWPHNLPVVYGDTYTVELNSRHGSSTFKMLVLYQLPENLPTVSHKVVWMVGKGCILQANMLMAGLR